MQCIFPFFSFFRYSEKWTVRKAQYCLLGTHCIFLFFRFWGLLRNALVGKGNTVFDESTVFFPFFSFFRSSEERTTRNAQYYFWGIHYFFFPFFMSFEERNTNNAQNSFWGTQYIFLFLRFLGLLWNALREKHNTVFEERVFFLFFNFFRSFEERPSRNTLLIFKNALIFSILSFFQEFWGTHC